MPYSAEHKNRTRDKILSSALKLFTRQGYAQTSIDAVMADAQLTRGAFYAHFHSKSDLYQKTMLAGALSNQLLQKKPDHLTDKQWLRYLIQGYLSIEHVRTRETPCPLAFMVTDAAISQPEVRQAYSKVYQRLNTVLTMYISQRTAQRQPMYAITAMMIGAVAVGRSIQSTAKLKALLNTTQQTIFKLLQLDD